MIDIRRIVSRVISWWLARRVEQRNPTLAALRREEAERRRQHRATRDIQKTRRALVHEALASEIRRAS